MSILDELRRNAESGAYPLHMPGHKRNPAFADGLPFALDVTEIAGFDDLHDMRGIIAETAALGAELYGATAAFPLVNGATGGLLAAVSAAAKSGGSLVFSKYSHRAVYNAAELAGLTPVIFDPGFDAATGLIRAASAELVRGALSACADACAVVLTSPTYEGAASDVAAVADAAHSFGVPLIADAAHGAHFGFSDGFPQNAVRLGADAEVVSLHKTLPGMTQTALLLAGDPRYISEDSLRRKLSVFQTTSPSYILLASVDNCLRRLRDRAPALFAEYSRTLELLDARLRGLTRLRRAVPEGLYDPGKIVISTLGADVSGTELHARLRGRGFECECSGAAHILAMTSVCDDRDALLRFADELLAIDAELAPADKTAAPIISPGVPQK
ncbi:MAG: DegT/DnrJ/EryC1/StrS family aminotransferase [Oscillospiraceae bacterium]|nr:DegT/DnrJ/EryC1/StrS family aminotransferase [Oscillospiraceae bacterium]